MYAQERLGYERTVREKSEQSRLKSADNAETRPRGERAMMMSWRIDRWIDIL